MSDHLQEIPITKASIIKQIQITKTQSPKRFDLEDRTLSFARRTREYAKCLPRNLTNLEFSRQLIRSACSVVANYIEANEALSKKDFLHRMKISRKECKETRYWLTLAEPLMEQVNEKDKLIQEITELLKIFGTIIARSE